MTQMKVENFDFVCRVCLNESNKMLSLFKDSASSDSIMEKFKTCTKISIFVDDTYPSLICEDCLVELNTSYNFYTKSNESDTYLRELSNKREDLNILNVEIKNEPVEVAPNDWDAENNSNSRDIFSDIVEKEVSKEELSDDDCNYSESDEKSDTSEENLNYDIEKSDLKVYKKKLLKKRPVNKLKRNKIKRNEDDKSNLLQCGTCNLKVQSNSALIIHRRTHTGEKPYSCHKCDRTFAQKSTHKIHILRCHTSHKIKMPKKHICENCGKGFANNSVLKIHMRMHTGETPYECKICLKRFIQLGSLIVHSRRHSGVRPYRCKLCDKTFVELNHLKRHQSVHSTDTPFICNICGKGLKSAYSLRLHTKLHSDEKEHVCDQCGMTFGIKCNLDTHVRIIHSEKSGLCTVCQKSYSDLADHMVKHTGEKPFQCEICSKRFARNRGLIAHNRQHTSADKYKCHIEGCNKSFFAQWVLECHIMKHTGLMAFTCKYCSKGFLRLCHLNRHMKLNHPNESNEMNYPDEKQSMDDNN